MPGCRLPGIPLTLVTIAGLPVMLGIGIDYAIQMHCGSEEVIIAHSPHDPEAAAGSGGLVVTSTVFVLLALQIAHVPWSVRSAG